MKNADRSYHLNGFFIREWNPLCEKVVLYIHGFPGCADQARLMTSAPLFQDFRLIAIDRPGYGQSEYQPKLTPVKFAKQLVKILDQLKIDKVRILSVSGGAPYSMALANLLQERAIKMCSIGGIGPLNKKNRQYLNPRQKKVWWFAQIVPTTVARFILERQWQKGLNNIENKLFSQLEDFSIPDQAVFTHPEISPVLEQTAKSAIERGPHGVLHDMKVFTRDWGFDLDKIDCSVTLWHGSEDDVVNCAFSEDMEKRLTKVNLQMIPGEGHFSIAWNYRDQILKDLLT